MSATISSQLPTNLPAKDTAASASCYRVQRRFNLRALIVLTTVIAAVCGLLQRLNTPPMVYVWWAVMASISAASQVFFPKNPRIASTIAGGVVYGVVANCFVEWTWYDSFVRMGAFAFMAACLFTIRAVLTGLFVGYACGTVVAGVFMLADWFSPKPMLSEHKAPSQPKN